MRKWKIALSTTRCGAIGNFEEQAAFRARCQTVLRGRGLLPESSRTRGARWATVLRRRGLLPESSRTRGPKELEVEVASPSGKRVASKSAGSSASPSCPRSAGYVCVNNATVREGGQGMTAETTPPFGDAQKPWGGHPSCDPAPLTTSFGTVGQWPPATGQWWNERRGGDPKTDRASQRGGDPKTDQRKEELSKQLGGEGRGPENPGVVAPLTSASCRGNCWWD